MFLLTRISLDLISSSHSGVPRGGGRRTDPGKIAVLHYGVTAIKAREFYTKLELNSLVKALWLPRHFWFPLVYFPFLPSRFPFMFRTEVRVGHRMQTADAVHLGALTLSSSGC